MTQPPTSSLAARRRVAVAAILGLLVVAGAWYFWPRGKVDGRAGGAPGSVVLVVSGDTQGWLTPCGCTSNQSGGLLRRGSYLEDLRKRHTVLYADAGGAIGGTTPYHAVKLAAVLRGEVRMEVAAHNLGASEIAMGPRALATISTATKIPFISANATSTDGGALAEPLRIVATGGMRVALAGVISPRFQTAEVRIGSPREAVLKAVGREKGKYDRLVILAYMPEDELESLARELPEADAIIGGPTGQSVAPHRVGPTLIASATNKGKFLAEIPLNNGASMSPRVVELNDTFHDAPGQLENVAAYLKELATQDFPASVTRLGFATDNTANVSGSQSCQSCHQEEHATWSRSKHAHAWDSLKSRGMHVDPSCQVCHTTVYGAPSGFQSVSSTPQMVNVGCESCHGPSAEHAKDPKKRTPFMASSQCITCHDHENSPAFEYQAYWSRIVHGKPGGATIPALKEARK